LEDRFIAYACSTCRLAQGLPDTDLGRHVARQLIRSGTAPAANYAEAQSAESRRDFIHKLRLCLKELRETSVWLRIAARLALLPDHSPRTTLSETDELIAILVTSIRTARRNSQ
jgi:four helix bundle protein